jgi:hypothetical protein
MGTPSLAYRVDYCGRVMSLSYDPWWNDEELRICVFTVMGVPEGNTTCLSWQDLCAQSDTAPHYILENISPEQEQQPATQPDTESLPHTEKAAGESPGVNGCNLGKGDGRA